MSRSVDALRGRILDMAAGRRILPRWVPIDDVIRVIDEWDEAESPIHVEPDLGGAEYGTVRDWNREPSNPSPLPASTPFSITHASGGASLDDDDDSEAEANFLRPIK